MATKHLKIPVLRSVFVTNNGVNLTIESFPGSVRNRLGRVVSLDFEEIDHAISLRLPSMREGHPELLRVTSPYHEPAEIKNLVDVLIDSLGAEYSDASKIFEVMMRHFHKFREDYGE